MDNKQQILLLKEQLELPVKTKQEEIHQKEIEYQNIINSINSLNDTIRFMQQNMQVELINTIKNNFPSLEARSGHNYNILTSTIPKFIIVEKTTAHIRAVFEHGKVLEICFDNDALWQDYEPKSIFYNEDVVHGYGFTEFDAWMDFINKFKPYQEYSFTTIK